MPQSEPLQRPHTAPARTSTPLPNSPCRVASDFVCPLTGDPLATPVIAPDGRTYERRAIRHYVDRHGHLPFDESPVATQELFADHTMAERLERPFCDAEHLLDPVHMTPMTDPVTASDGHTYDLSTLVQMIRAGHPHSPYTHMPLSSVAYRNRSVAHELALHGIEPAAGPTVVELPEPLAIRPAVFMMQDLLREDTDGLFRLAAAGSALLRGQLEHESGLMQRMREEDSALAHEVSPKRRQPSARELQRRKAKKRKKAFKAAGVACGIASVAATIPLFGPFALGVAPFGYMAGYGGAVAARAVGKGAIKFGKGTRKVALAGARWAKRSARALRGRRRAPEAHTNG